LLPEAAPLLLLLLLLLVVILSYVMLRLIVTNKLYCFDCGDHRQQEAGHKTAVVSAAFDTLAMQLQDLEFAD
jgi:hypothetical protein